MEELRNEYIIVINPDTRIKVDKLDKGNMLERFQGIVGGYIETVKSIWAADTFLLVDDEGLLKDKKLNTKASKIAGFPIFGTAIVVKTAFIDGEKDFCGLPQDEALHIIEYLSERR